MCKSVLFPAPDWPTMATISPASTSQVEIAEQGERPAGSLVGFFELFDPDDRLRRSRRRTATLVPAESG